jgi:hypothetical protein
MSKGIGDNLSILGYNKILKFETFPLTLHIKTKGEFESFDKVRMKQCSSQTFFVILIAQIK